MMDGSNSEQGSGACVFLLSPEGVEVSYVIRFQFRATNNQVAYEAFIAELKLTLALRAEKVNVQIDSQLVANHLNESFQTKDEKMEQYLKCFK